MTTAQHQIPDYTSDDAATYKTKIDGNAAVVARIGAAYQAYAASSPNMTVKVAAGALLVAGAVVENAIQTTGTITAPVSNSRIDRVVIDATTGVVSVITGTPGVSPTAPALTSGKLPVAQVLLTSASTAITNSMITDERATPTAAATGALTAIYNFTAQTVALASISNATPAVCTVTDARHLPEVGSPIQFTTSGGLPAGLSLATQYFVSNASGTTFNVCTTQADAMAGTNKVATSSAGSGTHTMNSVYVKGSESFIVVEGWGAGGGSGGMDSAPISGTSGGGSGGFGRKKIAAASLGATETITIGAGGTAGTSAPTGGGNGASTTFGSHLTVLGGSGSAALTSGAAVATAGAARGSGGDLNLPGNAGQAGIGPAGYEQGGLGGATSLGGAQPSGALGSAGVDGPNNSGCGATGSCTNVSNVAGGVGGSGRCIVYVYS